MTRGESATVLYPQLSTKLSNRIYLSKIIAHLDACKDVCDNFGIDTILLPYISSSSSSDESDGNVDGRSYGFTVKSYRNSLSGGAGTMSQDIHLLGGTMKFAPDPFWDDDEEWDFGNIDDDNDNDDANDGMMTRSSSSTAATATTTPPHLLLPNTDAQIISEVDDKACYSLAAPSLSMEYNKTQQSTKNTDSGWWYV
jgi:hypothetical protein